jgi:hypothetical protein
MDDKPKRKHDSRPSLWTFPKPFRYEVKGNFQHVIQAIEILAFKRADSAYTCDVQISSDALEGQTTFTIDRYLQAPKWKSEPHSETQIHGRIRSTQSGENVVEGYAFMGDESKSVLWRLLLCGVILLIGFAISSYSGDPLACIWAVPIATFPLIFIYIDKLSRDELLQELVTALQTYPMPLNEDPLNFMPELGASQSLASGQ